MQAKKFRFHLLTIILGVAVLSAVGSRLLLPVETTHGMSVIRDRKARTAASHAETMPTAPLPEQKAQSQTRALQILAKPLGFVPKEVTRPAGDYFFSVGNFSGVRELSLRLERENGAKLREVTAKRERPWKGIVHLTPGTYLLTEANHPEWVCRITISER